MEEEIEREEGEEGDNSILIRRSIRENRENRRRISFLGSLVLVARKVITHELRGEADLSTATMRLSTVRTSPEFSASLHESRFRSTIVHRLPTPVGDPCQRLLLCIPSIDPPPGIPVFGSNERPSSPALGQTRRALAYEFFSDQFPAIAVIYRDMGHETR